MHFALQELRFTFRAEEAVRFGRVAANSLRGALGLELRNQVTPALFQRVFAPQRSDGPSGLHDPPRPFVLRTRSLDRKTVSAGNLFSVTVNTFDISPEVTRALTLAFEVIGKTGLGPHRSRVALVTAEPPHLIDIDLAAQGPAASAVRVCLFTATELKGAADWPNQPSFSVLACRIRDRISTLCALYGEGPLPIDFRDFAQRSDSIQTIRFALTRNEASRKSSRSGQAHALSGVTGEIDYRGNLTDFLPYLEAARWTGVGRHTVWGKGELTAQPLTYQAQPNANQP